MYAYTFASDPYGPPPANPDELVIVVDRDEAETIANILRQWCDVSGDYFAKVIEDAIRAGGAS